MLFRISAASKRSEQLAVGLLLIFGLLIGAAVAPSLSYYAKSDPEALWDGCGATALFIVGFGAAGYGTRGDLSKLGRAMSWALLGLILFGWSRPSCRCRVVHCATTCWARHFRGTDQLRLSAAAPHKGNQDGAARRRVNLSRHCERVSPVLVA